MTIFVSYTRADETLVRALRDDLGRMGQRVWLDHEIHGGELWWREIIETIRSARVLVFALSQASWKSLPCREEFEYARQLGVPVLPVQVGPLDNLRIPIMERQIVDYRRRDADAIVALVGALTELTARPHVLPNPLPTPPKVPFEYLYRIAELLGPQPITPERQESIIGQLRRHLRTEEDEVARADIIKLLREFRERGEITNTNSREIDEILASVEEGEGEAPAGGVTRLPAADHWRKAASVTGPLAVPAAEAEPAESERAEPERAEPAPVASETVQSGPEAAGTGVLGPEDSEQVEPVRPAEPATGPRAEGQVPPSEDTTGTRTSANADSGSGAGTAPIWLRGVIPGGGGGRPTGEPPKTTPPPPSATSPWYAAPPPAAAPPATAPPSTTPTAASPASAPEATPRSTSPSSTTPPSTSGPSGSAPSTSQWWQDGKAEQEEPKPPARPSGNRPLAFVSAVLGALGIPFLLIALTGLHDRTPAVLAGFAVLTGLVLGVVSARRREPRSRQAVVIASVGLLGVIAFVLAAGGTFS